MNKAVVLGFALLAFQSKSFAYGVRTVENVSVQSVNCDYKVVTIQTRFNGPVRVAQNLTPLLVNAEFINTSAEHGRVSFGRQNMTLSMNHLTFVEGKMVQSIIDSTGQARTYFYDAALLTNEILADRKAACSAFATALAHKEKLQGPFQTPDALNSVAGHDPDFANGFGAVEFTVDQPIGSALSKRIQEVAYCSEIDNGGGDVRDSKLGDGTPVTSCRKL